MCTAGEYSSKVEDAERHREIDRILRVDHAGEYGAVRIYEGQMAVLQDAETQRLLKVGAILPSVACIEAVVVLTNPHYVVQEMRDGEVVHLRNLETLLPKRRARPTALLPLWNIAGFALGLC